MTTNRGTSNRRGPRYSNTPLRVEELTAEANALALRLAGNSYRQIAEQQGCTVSTAHGRVERALSSLVPAETVEELRKVSAARLEAVAQKVLEVLVGTGDFATREREILDRAMSAADEGQTELALGFLRQLDRVKERRAAEVLAASDRMVRVEERTSKLWGLDTPVAQRLNLTVTDEVDAELRALAAELAAAPQPEREA